MAPRNRPVSVLSTSSQYSQYSSFSVDHSPRTGHYNLRRSSYISELSEQDYRPPSRASSILRTASSSLSTMGLKLLEKTKEDISQLRPESHSIRLNERPSTSNGLFTRHISKGLMKAASLTTRSNTPTPIDERPHTPTQPRSTTLPPSPLANSSEASLATLKPRPEVAAADRQKQLPPPPRPPRRSSPRQKKTIWTRRQNMKIPTLRDQATYMQAYDPILLDNDRHFDILLRRLNPLDNPSFHDYAHDAPSRVLDLGCGPGYWLLEASRHWPQSQLVGFDMVNIMIPEVQGKDQIKFVEGNFLETPWSFSDKTFDLVRMANLSLCIPYNKWEEVLAQAHRVLTINGRLELIDDQIFFPYASHPASKTSTTAPPPVPPKPVALTRGSSFFDMDDNDDSDTDSNESTLIGDGDAQPVRHSHSQQSSAPRVGMKRHPVIAPLNIRNKVTDSSGIYNWSVDAAASRNLETIFQNMLHQKYGIHSRPSEFILDILQHVFGSGEKLRSFHLKLAPKDAQVESGVSSEIWSISEGSEKEKTVAEPKKIGLKELTRTLFNGDFDEKLAKLKATAIETQISLDLRLRELRLPDLHFTKSSGHSTPREELPEVIIHIPQNISAKAAHRLGLPMTSERGSDESLGGSPIRKAPLPKLSTLFTSSPSSSPSPTLTATPTQLSETSDEDSPTDCGTKSRLSAKAANRLGISYSALTQAAASAKAVRRPASSSSTLVSSPLTTIQSSGLIVWPSTFIPLSPSELEMHACKNVHALIGCKPALTEYIGSFLDEEGNRIESEESFDQAIWDYECFRRRRFHWPSDIPDWDVEPETDAPEFFPASRPVDDPYYSAAPDVSPPPTASYDPGELPHVRTLRVYQAVKTDDYSLSNLRFPRPTPSPLTQTFMIHD